MASNLVYVNGLRFPIMRLRQTTTALPLLPKEESIAISTNLVKPT